MRNNQECVVFLMYEMTALRVETTEPQEINLQKGMEHNMVVTICKMDDSDGYDQKITMIDGEVK